MSGGSLGYFYSELENHVGDFEDKELDDLVRDLAELFHDREWFLSCDTCEGNWNEARNRFKLKWFGKNSRAERIEKYLDDVKDDLLRQFGLYEKYCKNCSNWKPEEDKNSPYGWCKHHKGCMMHRSETCDMFTKGIDRNG